MVNDSNDEDVFFGEFTWIYYLGPLVGALLSSGFYFILYQEPVEVLKENDRHNDL
jgi:hypothetical protein